MRSLSISQPVLRIAVVDHFIGLDQDVAGARLLDHGLHVLAALVEQLEDVEAVAAFQHRRHISGLHVAQGRGYTGWATGFRCASPAAPPWRAFWVSE
jgi:hypothetical protein